MSTLPCRTTLSRRIPHRSSVYSRCRSITYHSFVSRSFEPVLCSSARSNLLSRANLPQAPLPLPEQSQPWWMRLFHQLKLLFGLLATVCLAYIGCTPLAYASDGNVPSTHQGAYVEASPNQEYKEYPQPVRKRVGRELSEWVELNDPIGTMSADISNFPADEDEGMGRGIVTSWYPERMKKMSYTQFLILLREGHLDKVEFRPNQRTMVVHTKSDCPYRGEYRYVVGLIYDPELYESLCAYGVEVDLGHRPLWDIIIQGLIRIFAPLFAIVIVLSWSTSYQANQDSKAGAFDRMKLEAYDELSRGATFDDIAGIDDVRDDVFEVVSFLKFKDEYAAVGAKPPAGVLLCGAPGVGKTLLARTIAGEAGVPFFSCSGADFNHVYAGVGAKKVRDMFEQIREHAPCVLFIDEFDGIGQKRSMADTSDNEVNVQTINQLLTEMDGFADNKGVIVLAATNRPAALDKALTRPGRFDRVINISSPNTAGRIDIMKVHLRGKMLADSTNLHRVARAAAGFTGAELMNLVNKAAIQAVRQNKQAIDEDDFFSALDLIHADMRGTTQMLAERETDREISSVNRRRVAMYMASKAIVAMASPGMDEVQRIVVTPRNTSHGFVYFVPHDAHSEYNMLTKSFVEGKLAVAMAGRVGESAVMGCANLTTLGGNDLEDATCIARDMIYHCGWSPRLGPISFEDDTDIDQGAVLGNISPTMAQEGLREMEATLRRAEAKALFGLVLNWELLEDMVKFLMEDPNHEMNTEQIAYCVDRIGLKMYLDSYLDGFGFDEEMRLVWPEHYNALVSDPEAVASGRKNAMPIVPEPFEVAYTNGFHPLSPYHGDRAYIPMTNVLQGHGDYLKQGDGFSTLMDRKLPETNGAGKREAESPGSAAPVAK